MKIYELESALFLSFPIFLALVETLGETMHSILKTFNAPFNIPQIKFKIASNLGSF